MTRGWKGGVNAGRCPAWEDRMVRPEHSGTSRTIRRQVRCVQPRGHDGACEWRGIAFGIHTADAIAERRRYATRVDAGQRRG